MSGERNLGRIDRTEAGMRLDSCLTRFFPVLSLRARRRMIETGRIYLNHAQARCAVRVREGDLIGWVEEESKARPLSDEARFIARMGAILFFYKPRFMHTLSLAGGSKGLDSLLASLYPEGQKTELLQRLDYGTSGLVAAAGGEDVAGEVRTFRAAEKKGQIRKKYLALLEGRLAQSFTIRNALDTNDRRQSSVRKEDGDPLRWTELVPLCVFRAGSAIPDWLVLPGVKGCQRCDLTLAGVSIRLGARHQIRAHAASAGFPLLGDTLYGGRELKRPGFFLHQTAVVLPKAFYVLFPPWIVGQPAEVSAFVQKNK